MKTRPRLVLLVLAGTVLAGLALAGCSSGDGGDEATPTQASGGDGGTSDGDASGEGDYTLTVSVEGSGSVEYHLASGQRLICPPDCTASFPATFTADMQRELSLPQDEDAGARLSAWGGDCSSVDAEVEPRGGHCRLLMDGDKSATVAFEKRPRVRVSVTGKTASYSITFAGSQANPLAANGGQQCAAPCTHDWYYDLGTEVTLAEVSAGPAYLRRWGGACSGVAGWDDANTTPPEACVLTLDDDVEVAIQFSSINGCAPNLGPCNYDPP
jgi:hypothetical protein